MNPLQGVLAEAWRTYRTHAAHLLTIAFVVYLGLAAVDAVLTQLGPGGAVLSLLIAVLGVYLLQAALVKAVEDVRDGRVDLSLGDTLRAARPRLLAVTGASILAGIVIVVGLILLIVPGLVAATYLAVIVPVVVLEGAGVLEAFRRSADLVRGHGMQVFGVLVLTFLVYLGGGLVVGLFLLVLPEWARTFLGNIISGTVLAPFAAVTYTLMYYRLAGATGPREPEDIWAQPT